MLDNSAILFDQLSAYGDTGMVDTRMSLQRGRADTRVRPAVGPGSRFEIHTPSAISAVRGTAYRAAVSEDSSTSSIEVLSGKVWVKGARKSRVLHAGFGARVETGQALLAARKLLEAPLINALPAQIRQLNWPLTWQPLDGAAAYRVELAASDAFATLLWQRLVDAPRASLPDLPDGVYYVRVRGVDEIGLEGLNVARKLVLDARPQPPLPLSPQQDEVFRATAPTLRWTASSDAAAYRLQVASDERFEAIEVDRQGLQENAFELEGLADPGVYYWRLFSIDADGEQGPVSALRRWRVKAIPEQLDATLEVGEERIIASWREGAPGQSYELQVALDPEFQQLLLQQSLEQAQLELEPVKGQIRFLRVRIVEPDGFRGPWGATQKIDPVDSAEWLSVFILAMLGFLLL